jgi:hypothetical protein
VLLRLPLHSRPLQLCMLPNPLPVLRRPSCTCSTDGLPLLLVLQLLQHLLVRHQLAL